MNRLAGYVRWWDVAAMLVMAGAAAMLVIRSMAESEAVVQLPALTVETADDGTCFAKIDVAAWQAACRQAGLPVPPELDGTDPVTVKIILHTVEGWIATRSGDVIGRLGQLYVALEEHERALDCFAAAVELGTEKVVWMYFVGVQLQMLGRTDEAIAALRTAAQNDPSYPTTFARLGQLLLEKNDYEEAKRMFEAYRGRIPNESLGYIGLGRVALAQHDEVAAIDALQAAVEMSPGDFMAHRLLSHAYAMKGQQDLARSESAIAEKLPEYRGWLSFDLRLQECHRLANTQRHLSNELKLAIQSRDLNRSRDVGEQLLARRPNDAEILSTMAGVYFNLGQKPQAVAAIEKAAQLRPDAESVVQTRAEIAMMVGDLAVARTSVQHLLDLQPQSSRGHELLGRLLFFSDGKPDEGIQAVRRAIELDRESRQAKIALVDMLVRSNQRAAAIEVLEQWVLDDPADAWVKEQLEQLRASP